MDERQRIVQVSHSVHKPRVSLLDQVIQLVLRFFVKLPPLEGTKKVDGGTGGEMPRVARLEDATLRLHICFQRGTMQITRGDLW